MFDYLKSRSTALGLLKKFGRLITVEKVTTGVYDPDTSSVTNVTTTESVYACDFAIKGDKYNPDTVRIGDREAIIAGTVQIEQNNTLIIDGVRWSIVSLDKLAPSGTAVIYTAQIRK